MPKIDAYEAEILSAYEEGKLKSVATKEELAKFKAAARAMQLRTGRSKAREPLRVDERKHLPVKDVSG